MTCIYCGAETECDCETDLPRRPGGKLKIDKFGVCRKKRCRQKLDRRLNRRMICKQN